MLVAWRSILTRNIEAWSGLNSAMVRMRLRNLNRYERGEIDGDRFRSYFATRCSRLTSINTSRAGCSAFRVATSFIATIRGQCGEPNCAQQPCPSTRCARSTRIATPQHCVEMVKRLPGSRCNDFALRHFFAVFARCRAGEFVLSCGTVLRWCASPLSRRGKYDQRLSNWSRNIKAQVFNLPRETMARC